MTEREVEVIESQQSDPKKPNLDEIEIEEEETCPDCGELLDDCICEEEFDEDE